MEGFVDSIAQFSTVEYMVVAIMLLLSLLIGVYFSFCSPQDSYDEYIFAGRKMGVLPVAMSQVASNISGIALVGTPAEVYSYGFFYCVAMLADMVIPLITIKFFLPIFYKLQTNSLFEYLEMRFDRKTRILRSLVYTISQIVYLPALVYVPSLVFNQVSGLPVTTVALIISGVCILYTTFGGLKAVLWTDTLQNVFSLGAMLFVIWLGLKQTGGLGAILDISEEGRRTELLNFDVSPTSRNSFWAMFIGCCGNWLVYLAINPGSLQRSMSMPSMEKASVAMLWTGFGVLLIHLIVSLMGLVLYARYSGCDPIATGEIKKTGQMLPLYVMEVTKGYPGLAGLFVSGILSAALSSMSSSMNTMSGTIYEDVVEEFIYKRKKQSESKKAYIMKFMSCTIGMLGVLLVLLVNKTDSVFTIGMGLPGITNGALITLFIMGLFIPRANSEGAVAGAASSLVLMSWVVIKAQFYMVNGQLKYPSKFTSVDQCPGNFSSDPLVQSRLETWRGFASPTVADESVPYIYQVGLMYYSLLGSIVGLAVGIAVSYATAPPRGACLDPRLFSPYVHKYLPTPAQETSDKTHELQRINVAAKEENKEVIGADEKLIESQNTAGVA